MKMIKLIFLFLIISGYSYSQSAPAFWNDIASFKESDSSHFPPKDAVLFVGSSSIRFWTTIQQDFSNDSIINRGFGGSTLPDVTRYFYDIIFPYSPKKIFVYCGENDLAAPYYASAKEVLKRFETLFCMMRTNFPKATISFISIKPSPSRKSIQPEIIKANFLVRQFLKDKKNTHFIDVYKFMADKNGNIRGDIFRPDELHMNRKGYEIWIREVKPYLNN